MASRGMPSQGGRTLRHLGRLDHERGQVDARVLFSALSPNGEVLVTGAGDENLKFWRIWEAKEAKKKSKAKQETSVGRGILSIR